MKITSTIYIDESEIHYTAIRSPGPGGQHVNKTATGIMLRFNILESDSLSSEIKQRMVHYLQNKISADGSLIIKATRFRAQNQNKIDARSRLQSILIKAAVVQKKRRPTKITSGIKKRRLAEKQRHGKLKTLRSGKPAIED